MTKKKAASGKTARAKAAAAANRVQPGDLAEAPKPPKAAAASAAAPTPDASNARLARPAPLASAGRPVRRPQSLNFAGVGRNDMCPCGSGKRFKNCHGH